MATTRQTLSGTSISYTEPDYAGRRFVLSLSQSYTSGVAKSTISWTLSMEGGSSLYYGVGPTYLRYSTNGGSTWNYEYNLTTYKDWETKTFPAARGSTSKTFTVDHNTDGTKTIIIEFHNDFIYRSNMHGPYTWVATWNLETIPMYATFTSSSLSSLTETGVTASWGSDYALSKIEYSINGGSSYTQYGGTISATSGTIPISGLSPGTTYNIYLRGTRKDSGLTTTKSLGSKTTYKYPYIQNFSSTTLTLSNNSQTRNLSIYNPLGRSISVYASKATSGTSSSNTIALATGTGTSASLTITASTAISKYTWGASETTKTIYYYVIYGSYTSPAYSDTLKLNSATTAYQPSFSGQVSYTDTAGYRTTWGSYLSGKSVIKLTGTPTITGWNGATIKSKVLTINGVTYYPASDGSYTIGILSPTSNSIKIVATDSRGFQSTYNQTLSQTAYSPPSITTYGVERTGSFDSDTIAIYAGRSYTSLTNGTTTNSVVVKATASPTNSSMQNLAITATTEANAQTVAGFDPGKSYTITLTATDTVGSTATATISLNASQPIVYVDPVYKGVGINCFPESEGVYSDYVYLDNDAYLTYDETNKTISFRFK